MLGFKKLAYLLVSLGERLNNLVIGLLLIHLFLLGIRVFLSSISKLVLELLNDIEIGVGNFVVIVLDFGILLGVLRSELSNSCILLLLDHSNLRLSLVLHFSSQIVSLGLELEMNLIANSFELLSLLGLNLILFLSESIQILLVSLLLLLDAHFDGSKILLKFSLVDAVLILDVFKSDLSFFLKLSQLIKVLEDQMLGSLLVDLDFDLMLFIKIL